MRFYEFGDRKKPSILLLPGTACHWKNNFGHVIAGLEKDFFVICASYDGFDEKETKEFPDMLTETVKIESYIKEKLDGKVDAVYGCSLGGSFVGLLAQRGKIHMKHGILGSSDLDQASAFAAGLQSSVLVPLLYHLIHKARVPKWLYRHMVKAAGEEYTRKGLRMMGIRLHEIETDRREDKCDKDEKQSRPKKRNPESVKMDFVSRQSMKNQYYSDLITRLDTDIKCIDTSIHCFYAEKMGKQYRERYELHFHQPHILSRNLLHEELLLCYPKEWIEDIRACVLDIKNPKENLDKVL